MWILAAVSGLVYYALAFWFYINGLRQTTAAMAGLTLNLIPIFGVAGAHFLLNERLVAGQWLGALLIVGAVAAISRTTTAVPAAAEP
jgi:drug/metabolite transporter (DMT)-like permease